MRDKTPLVSVTICCYNSERYIVQTIQSVLDQTFTDFELIIVNDGSTDRTEEIVLGFADPRIRYEYQENRGLAATRNRTLELARGKYVAFLDHDDLWMPDKLALQISLMGTREDVAVVYGNAATIDADGNIISERYNDFRIADGNVFTDLLIYDFINWQTVVMRRSVLEDLGGFRPYDIVEDYDVLLRSALGHTFVGIDQVVAQYRRHASNSSHNSMKLWLELLELKEYWLAHLPEPYKELRPSLQRDIAWLHYSIGMGLYRVGNIQTGKAHLRRAWSESKYRYELWIILTHILGDVLGADLYRGLVKFRHRWLAHTDKAS